jgi:hypothetical protein
MAPEATSNLLKNMSKILHNKAHSVDCKKWHAIFVYAKAAPLFATTDVRRYNF